MIRRFKLGDLVRENDGRHVGRVVALFGHGTSATTVTVRWPNGWRSNLQHNELTLIEHARREPPFESDARIVWEDA